MHDVLSDPEADEALGTGLARDLAGLGIDRLVVWDDLPDVVLGHVVARCLGIAGTMAVEQEGLVELSGALPAGARVALLAHDFRTDNRLLALLAIVRRHQGVIAAVATAEGARVGAGAVPHGAAVITACSSS
jgi:hypothetical protein